MAITIKNEHEIALMRESGRLLALVHEEMRKELKEGMTTKDIDQICETMIRDFGCIPNFLNYQGFPASVCVSINDEVVHGIPSKREVLKEGDIVSVDLVAYKDGFNGDCCRTYAVGKIDKASQRLIDVTKQAFFEGIKYAKKGNRLGDISHAIGEYVEKNGFSVVREFQGHGIGREMHEDPGIPNYGKAGRGPRLEPGMTLAIEPMVIAGKPNILELDDGWGIITEDGTRAAHYENTILITEKEPKILTIV